VRKEGEFGVVFIGVWVHAFAEVGSPVLICLLIYLCFFFLISYFCDLIKGGIWYFDCQYFDLCTYDWQPRVF
jgi:hypothetical protein